MSSASNSFSRLRWGLRLRSAAELGSDSDFDRVVAGEPGGAFELGDERIECAVLMMRRAEITKAGVELASDLLGKCRGEPRLADARLAGDQHHPSLAGLRLLPATDQQLQLLGAADERHRPRAQCLEAAHNSALAQYLPSRDRRGHALKFDLAEIPIVEQVAGQPAGTGGDHDGVGLGQDLQASGEIWRITGDIVLDDFAADDHQPGGDPHPHVKVFGLIELRHPIDQHQTASRGALGIILVRLRIAEVDQHAVTHVAGYKPAKAFDDICDAAMIGADDPTQILGIEPCRQRR